MRQIYQPRMNRAERGRCLKSRARECDEVKAENESGTSHSFALSIAIARNNSIRLKRSISAWILRDFALVRYEYSDWLI